ncbi:MAG: hypothetical protein H7251_09325 [Acetobacteraceae bacterium]|nr:hypothetical protein [Acetobacteraceae bacterium]
MSVVDKLAPPLLWPQADGSPVSCREKLKTLADNHRELAQTLRDVFDDAILIGVDEAALRGIMTNMVAALESPKRRA